ncbi:uncharacterized protein Tco025E_07498 [Trypanosoma conorhini]|uniref:t-SNARE coiled-coil homology domain-containing protein n=1 Tax=Trypanosoma conorhini TaxID=83891 RepID=A0A3R7MIZ9_9TRYP|nr:uncharacterized protein Tco025E_07498 [Trypanosoma conorhini]RNF06792.1 hypothetical protein Tco025E_07498 [Trypanosoma conorhini]
MRPAARSSCAGGGAVADKSGLADATVDALQRAARDAQGAVETGVTTTRRLQLQEEQMRRVDRSLVEVEQGLGAGDRALLRMTWTGRIKSWFMPPPPPSNGGAPSSSPAPPRPPGEQPEQTRRREETSGGGADGVGGRGSRLCREEEEEEEERLLDALLDDVHAMREQATLQAAMLNEHNRHLDAMAAKTAGLRNHMERTNQRVEKML